MDSIKIIQKYCDPKFKNYSLLITHSKMVAKKALKIAKRMKHLDPDLKFIEEAAMLHDIGICALQGKPYICHGYLGREILEKEGFPKHALVCERHTGVGLTKKEIIRGKLPIPKRDMIPITLEEKIICFADKFFSKKEEYLKTEKSIKQIQKELSLYGEDKVKKFEEWLKMFKE
ncbi:MAG: HD domain-containing protein [Promethearchaeota archaeon]